MTRGALMATMKYLGFVTHLEDGTPNPIAEKVCDDLEGRVIETVLLPCQIGERWNVHSKEQREKAK